MTYKAVRSSSDTRESLNRAAVIHISFQAVALPADLGCRVKGLPVLLPGPRSVPSLRHGNLGSLGSNDPAPLLQGNIQNQQA